LQEELNVPVFVETMPTFLLWGLEVRTR